jgi:hypothetical protein
MRSLSENGGFSGKKVALKYQKYIYYNSFYVISFGLASFKRCAGKIRPLF